MPDRLDNLMFQNEPAQPVGSNDPLEKESLRTRCRRYFLGDDVFISYSRLDGRVYAEKLAILLKEKCRLSCYADFRHPLPGEKLPAELIEKLKESTVLVVLISRGAVQFPENIKQEIALFRKTGRAIFVIDLNKSYRREDWDLPGCDGLPDSFNPESSEALNAPPSETVLRSLQESFKYQTQYQKQRRNAWVSAVLLVASVVIVAMALTTRSRALGEAEAAIREKSLAVNESDRINREFLGVQERLNSIQMSLKKKEKDLDSIQRDLRNASSDRDKANAARSQAEKQVTLAQNNLKSTEALVRQSEKQLVVNNIKAKGTEASLLAHSPGKNIESLYKGVEAIEASLALDPSFDAIPLEAQKGLTEAAVAVDFVRLLQPENEHARLPTLSPNGEFIFEVASNNGSQQERIVLREVKNLNKSYVFDTGTSESVKQLEPSRNGRWLLLGYDKSLVLLEILTTADGYQLIRRSQIQLPVESWLTYGQVRVNSDASKIAVVTDSWNAWEFSHNVHIGEGIKFLVRDGYDLKWGEEVLAPAEDWRFFGMAFSPADELVIMSTEYDDEGMYLQFYNATKQAMLLGKFRPEEDKDRKHYEFEEITDAGELILSIGTMWDGDITKCIIVRPTDGTILDVVSPKDDNNPYTRDAIRSLRRIKGNYIKISGVSGRSCLVDYPTERVWNLTPAFNSSDSEPRFFHILDTETLIGESSHFFELNYRFDGPWKKIFFSDEETTPGFHVQDRTPTYLLYTERLHFTDDYKAHVVSNASQCRINMSKSQFWPRIFRDKYVIMLNEDFSLSFYDPKTCEAVQGLDRKIKLVSDEPTLRRDGNFLDIQDVEDLAPTSNGFLVGIYESYRSGSTDKDSFALSWDLRNVGRDKDHPQDSHSVITSKAYRLPGDSTLSNGLIRSLESNNNTHLDVHIFHITDGSLRKAPLKFNSWARDEDIAVSKSGKYLAILESEHPGKKVEIWDTRSGKQMVEYDVSGLDIEVPFGFSTDEEAIGLTCGDGKVRFYPTSIEGLYKLAKELLGSSPGGAVAGNTPQP